MKPTVYIETSIISYLASHPSRDLVAAAHQQITHEWWRRRRPSFELFASQLVVDEAAAGNSLAAERRSSYLVNLPLLDITPAVSAFAAYLARSVGIPVRASADALHIATATCHGVDFLLTWNCAHIANAELRFLVERSCREQGYEAPALCTPEELMGEYGHEY